MANFSALIASIEAYVKQNGNNAITGDGLQDILVAMVNSIGGASNEVAADLAAEVTTRGNADYNLQQSIAAEAQAREGAVNGEAYQRTQADNALQTAINAIKNNIDNGFVYAGIATPSGTPVSGKVFYLTAQAGTYTNYGGLVVPTGINVLKYDGTNWSQEQVISMADIYRNPLMGYYECDTAGATAAKEVAAAGYVLPTTGGSVKIKMANRNTVANATLNINSTGAKPLFYNGVRAGVGNTWDTNEVIEVYYDGTNYQAHNVAGSSGDGVFDISAYNLTEGQPTSYADLEAALGVDGANVPLQFRKGGMSVKFIQGSVPGSDNKYVQFRCVAQNFTTDVTQWQGVDDEPTAGSDNLVKSGGVFENLHYYGKPNGPSATFDILLAYEQGIYDCFVSEDISSLSIRAYSPNLYIKVDNNEAQIIPLNNITDYEKVNIISNEIVIGYVIFRDIQKFKDNSQVGSNQFLNIDFVKNPALHTSLFVIERMNNISKTIQDTEHQLKHFYIKEHLDGADSAIIKAYDSALSDLYINSSLFNVTYCSLRSYGHKIYIHIRKDNEGTASILIEQDVSSIRNYVKYNLTYNNIIVGHYIIKNKLVFDDTNNNIPGSQRALLNIDSITDNLLHNYLYETPADSIGNEQLVNHSVTYNKINFNKWYSITNEFTTLYEQGLLDVFIDNDILPITNMALREYTSGGESSIYCTYKLDGDTSWNSFDNFPEITANISNGVEYSLFVSGVKVGYLIFKDIDKYKNSQCTGSQLATLDIEMVTSKHDAFHSRTFYIIKPEVERYVDNAIHNNLSILLPSKIYAVVGTELNLWNDSISYCLSRGLQSPMNYNVFWQCSVGVNTSRCYRFTPNENHAGNEYNLTCTLVDVFGNTCASKTIVIKVLAKNTLNSQKHIVFFGDSTGAETATGLYNDLHDNNRFTGAIPEMKGSRGSSTIRYEAVGGYRWSDYATAGRAAFRCYIGSGAPTIPLNAKYTNNGFTWEVVEVNITDGSGNILITKDEISYADHPTPSGTLVAVSSGVSDINYDSYTNAPANPLWDATLNGGVGGLSIEHYKSVLGVPSSYKFDAVSFFLGLNGDDTNEVVTGYIKDLYNLFINDNANCKVIIGTITASNTEDGYGINYGASIPTKNGVDKRYRLNKLYLSLLDDPTMSNLRICPAGNEIDRYYGYPFTTRQISQRYTETEKVQSNGVHPASSGYAQFGDAFFADFVGVLTE